MRERMERLQPLHRSLTGDGVRESLAVLGESVPLRVRTVPSGARVFDWTVPEEWSVRAAYVADGSGRRVVDVAEHPLHLVGYSTPVRARLGLDELRPHLHSLPEQPDVVPFRTSYYTRDWGFCLRHRDLLALAPGEYDVVVDTTLAPGELTYGEVVVPATGVGPGGRAGQAEVLVTSHVCHPAMANDNLTGLTVAVELAAHVAALPQRRHAYRFLFAPGTLGVLAWLARNPDLVPRVRHALVLTGLGGGGPLVYKQTRHGDRGIDRAVRHVVGRRGGEVRAYSPWGYDERQLNAVGFGVPAGRLTRTPHGEYPEYHTSADDLAFVGDDELVDALEALTEVVDVLEHDAAYTNLAPYGEPQLGPRGLYPATGGRSADEEVMAMLWTLGYSDGATSLLAIAETAGLPFATVRAAAARLAAAGLLAERSR